MAKKIDESVKEFTIIERLDIMEDKFGIYLEGVNATYEYASHVKEWKFDVYGEIQAINGTGIKEDIDIVAIVYSNDGKMLGTTSCHIIAADFFAISPFHVYTYISNCQEPAKVRIYPKKRPSNN